MGNEIDEILDDIDLNWDGSEAVDVLPPGEYILRTIDGNLDVTNSNSLYLALTVQVVEPEELEGMRANYFLFITPRAIQFSKVKIRQITGHSIGSAKELKDMDWSDFVFKCEVIHKQYQGSPQMRLINIQKIEGD